VARRLIVNADDFGRSPGITRGILDAHHLGIVTSTTLMVNLPWSVDAAGLAQSAPDLGLGLHLSFCYGPSLCHDASSLLGADGNLNRDLALLRKRASSDDIERECHAQIERFVALTGRKPAHLDSHQHVHTWPNAFPAVAVVAREYGLPVRAGSAEHARRLRDAGLACPDAFVMTFFGADRIDADSLIAILRALPDGVSELMCHPGYDDEALRDSSYRAERETELRTLCAPEIHEVIAREGIELVTFGALGES
jgi:chitin disaccharide deacetylase